MKKPEGMRQKTLIYCRSLEDVTYWIQTFTDFAVELELGSHMSEQYMFLVSSKINAAARNEIKEIIKKFINGGEEGEKALMLFSSEDSFDEVSHLAYRVFVRLPLQYDSLLWAFLNRVRQSKIDCLMTIPNSEDFIGSDWMQMFSLYTWRKDSRFCISNETLDGHHDFLWLLYDMSIIYLGIAIQHSASDYSRDCAYDAQELSRFISQNNIGSFAALISRNDFSQIEHEYEFATSFLEGMCEKPNAAPLLYFGHMTCTMSEWMDSDYGFSISSFYPNQYLFLFDSQQSLLTLVRSGHVLAHYTVDRDALVGKMRVVFADNPQQIERATLNFEGAQRIYYKAKYVPGNLYSDVDSGKAYMIIHPHTMTEWLNTLFDIKNFSAGAGN